MSKKKLRRPKYHKCSSIHFRIDETNTPVITYPYDAYNWCHPKTKDLKALRKWLDRSIAYLEENK